MAVYGKFVFVTNSIGGFVRFNIENGTSEEIFGSTVSIDLNIGLNDMLYVLSPGGSPGGRIIDVYEPVSLSFIRRIDLTTVFGWNEHRAVAGAENGDIYAVNWDGDIRHLNYLGELIQTINVHSLFNCTSCGSFYDIDISNEGLVYASDRSGTVYMFDKNLSFIGLMTTELKSGVFVAPISKVSVRLIENDAFISVQENLTVEFNISNVNVSETVDMKIWYEDPAGLISNIKNKKIWLYPGAVFYGQVFSGANNGQWKKGEWKFGVRLIRSIDGKVLSEHIIPIVVE